MGFDFFNIMFFGMFFLVFVVILFNLFRGIKQWNYNNKQPIIPVKSRVVSKRISVSHHNNGNNVSQNSTTYYVTFQFDNEERVELRVSGEEYGMMVEGDSGVLSFQGTRFKGFKRN